MLSTSSDTMRHWDWVSILLCVFFLSPNVMIKVFKLLATQMRLRVFSMAACYPRGWGVLATFLYGEVRVNIWGLRYCNKVIFGVCELQLKKNAMFLLLEMKAKLQKANAQSFYTINIVIKRLSQMLRH